MNTKSIILTAIAILGLFTTTMSQLPNTLYGTYWNGNVEIFTSLDFSTKTFTNLGYLQGVHSFIQGETTFDANNNRYFCQTNLGITIINAQTGTIIDTIANPIGMMGIEYDPNSNRLVGTYWNGSVTIFTSLNISTKTFTDLSPLPNVQSYAQGEATFDINNKRCFYITNLGITIINAQTGTIIDTIANQIGMVGIEYDPNSNKLIGSYWNGSVNIFTSLDISTKTFTDLLPLPGFQFVAQGETTNGTNSNRYVRLTDLGIFVINAQTGTIIDTISNTVDMKGLELNNSICNTLKPNSVITNKNNFCANDTDSITLTAIGGIGDTLHWYSGGCGLNSIGINNPLSIASPSQTITFYARWECGAKTSDCDSITIYIKDCGIKLELPNIITPNNDGINDKFRPIISENIKYLKTQIFNRWGNIVYETNNLQIEWNGKSNGKLISDGVYYWIIKYIDLNGVEGMLNGSVTVLK